MSYDYDYYKVLTYNKEEQIYTIDETFESYHVAKKHAEELHDQGEDVIIMGYVADKLDEFPQY